MCDPNMRMPPELRARPLPPWTSSASDYHSSTDVCIAGRIQKAASAVDADSSFRAAARTAPGAVSDLQGAASVNAGGVAVPNELPAAAEALLSARCRATRGRWDTRGGTRAGFRIGAGGSHQLGCDWRRRLHHPQRDLHLHPHLRVTQPVGGSRSSSQSSRGRSVGDESPYTGS